MKYVFNVIVLHMLRTVPLLNCLSCVVVVVVVVEWHYDINRNINKKAEHITNVC